MAAGWLTTIRWRLPNSRVRFGWGLWGNGRLRISGPGRVELGNQVNAWSHAEVNRLITTTPAALITIGRNVRLNGCTLVAADRITVGADCVLGSCEIRDHEPSSVARDRHGWAQAVRPVVVEDNVWIGGQVLVMPGVRIGRDSVVGLHAVVFEDVPPGAVVAGNPARVVRRLEPRA